MFVNKSYFFVNKNCRYTPWIVSSSMTIWNVALIGIVRILAISIWLGGIPTFFSVGSQFSYWQTNKYRQFSLKRQLGTKGPRISASDPSRGLHYNWSKRLCPKLPQTGSRHPYSFFFVISFPLGKKTAWNFPRQKKGQDGSFPGWQVSKNVSLVSFTDFCVGLSLLPPKKFGAG